MFELPTDCFAYANDSRCGTPPADVSRPLIASSVWGNTVLVFELATHCFAEAGKQQVSPSTDFS